MGIRPHPTLADTEEGIPVTIDLLTGTRREVSEVIMNVTIETPHHEIVNDDELLETKIMPTSITDGTRGAIASRTVMVVQRHRLP